MTKDDQVKNIIAFLSIIFGETKVWHEYIMNMPPDYLIEKFNRYILSTRDEHSWGLHPSLRICVFNRYCEKWHLPTEQYTYIGEDK